jgi:NAD+ synthase (glutamine-hydrolysing)
VKLARAGATLILNLSASDEVAGKAGYRRDLVVGQSGRLVCGYVYADAGDGESSTDLVFAGHNMVAENGALLAESRFGTGLTISEVDVAKLVYERRRMTTFPARSEGSFLHTDFTLDLADTALTRPFSPTPFVPQGAADRGARCDEILRIAALGLKKRLEHTHAACAVLGLSGGLDSTLAILITAMAFDLLGRDRKDILAVTMPCFGTTARTRSNAELLAEELGTDLRVVDIGDAVRQHFADIGQPMDDHSVTFENGQARERTQVLMDLANKRGGLVIGTGDLSELALGWATYNGDHMSMYGVNASIPKTLVRHLVAYVADQKGGRLADVLRDILDTPVSPELLPPKDGEIAQRTEDLVGPYELHDFFLYYAIRWGFPPRKVLRLAEHALGSRYDRATLLRWLNNFYRRFFAQQFKRSCLPDGPKVGSLTLSPRGDWRMPSDAVATLWLKELEGLT